MPFVDVADGKSPYTVLEGLYRLGEVIGSGGFGKVRLATHNLTGEKVAIKIIDKIAIGADLPRVKTELHALKSLWHQNINRLYQWIETPTKYFLVLEYCSGGELFDYIVKKECLPEPEARHFFRQIVSALAYVHSKGFAHRDLKPENLLLTDLNDGLEVKLIDFGLSSSPTCSAPTIDRVLETCCGSPAYAAPELIKSQPYNGSQADVWSMGILLYALLCGSLPFEDDNIQNLYAKITSGKYPEPAWLSNDSKMLLKQVLRTDPCRRISIDDLLKHPWVQGTYKTPLKWRSIYDPNLVDEECIRELAIHYHESVDVMRSRVKKWEYDYVTATYFMCLNRKKRKQPVLLQPMRKPPTTKPACDGRNVDLILSPTIHASLDEQLDRSGLDDDDDSLNANIEENDENVNLDEIERDFNLLKLKNNCMKQGNSYVNAVSNRPLTEINSPLMSSKQISTTSRQDMPPPMSIIATPKRPYTVDLNRKPITPKPRSPSAPNTPGKYETPITRSRDTAIQCSPVMSDTKNNLMCTPRRSVYRYRHEQSDKATPDKTPGSRSRRMFASVERAKTKMITLLTPRRPGPSARPTDSVQPQCLKRTNTTVNVSTTGTADAQLVRDELIKAFERRHIQCETNGWKIHGSARQHGRWLKFDLEVVFIEHLQVVGIRRKRLQGDAFLYKRVCEDILNLARL